MENPSIRTIVLSVLVVSFGCTSQSDLNAPSTNTPLSPSATETSAKTHWNAQLQVSGGFSGMTYRIAIDDSGAWTLRDDQNQIQSSKTVSPEQTRTFGTLSGALPTQDLVAINEHCADCFNYWLVVESAAGHASYRLDSTTLESSPAHTLINALIKLKDQ